MNMLRFLLLCALAIALPVHAEIYKYVDESGHVTYSNKPIKGGKKIELPEISTMPAPKPAIPAAQPAKPAPADAAADKAKRRQDLEAQIAQAEKALAEAKKAYQEGSEKPEVWQHKTPEGKVVRGRNVPAYEEKMKALQAEVDARQKALDELKAQLAALNAPPPNSDEKR